MITRAQMQRQLRNNGGVMTVKTIRKKYGIGSDLKDFVRKIIPNEIADVAVKAAPIVAPFYPGTAALMRGIGRFDQRGSLSDAFKQGALTYAGGRGIGMLGGAQSPEGFLGRQKFSMEGFKEGPIGSLFKSDPTKAISKVDQGLDVAPGDTTGLKGFAKKVIKKLPEGVAAQLAAGTLTAGASLLASYFQGEFREHDPETETYEDFLAQRKEVVGSQMRTYMDNYFKFDKEYSTMTDEQKDAFVARYNVRDGGRVGLQEGGLPTVESLGGSEPNVKGGSIVYDLGNGEYIYQSPVGFELVRDGVYTSLGSGYANLQDLLNSGTVLRNPNDPIRIAEEAESARRMSELTKQQAAPTTAAPTPTGIQTIPDEKFAVNVMFDEKGNVADNQGIPELLRQRGTGSNITGNVPINSMSDVFRLAEITGEDGISMGTDYSGTTLPSGGDANTLPRGISMRKTLQENLAANEAQRAANQKVLEAARARLPGAGIMNAPVDVMLPTGPNKLSMLNRGDFAKPVTLDGQQFTNEADAIAGLGIERYNQLMATGGRVGFATGTGPKTEKLIAAEKLAKKEGISIAEALQKIFEEANKEGVIMIKVKEDFVMPKSKPKKAKGGLMSIPVRKNSEGIKELDMRKSGGFVPIGVKEKADDVPAMLSKNEFVMTADAVRAAGGGSINKGAQRMYDTMKKLESRVA